MGVKTLSEVADEAFRARGVEPVNIKAENRHMSVAGGGKRRLGRLRGCVFDCWSDLCMTCKGERLMEGETVSWVAIIALMK